MLDKTAPDRLDAILDRTEANQGTSAIYSEATLIARLSRLDTLSYDRCRKDEAKQLGVRVEILDAEVQAFRRSARQAARANGAEQALPPRFSDDALALTFTGRHEGQLLYVPAWNAWLTWDGCRWVRDNVLTVYDLARIVCRDASADAAMQTDGESAAVAVTSARTVAAVERLARSDPRHARSAENFDADRWILNTPGGVVDLRTGRMRPHTPNDMLTKVAGATPGGECPRFLAFLKQITQDDAGLAGFLQRFIGYTLTASIQEHAFIFAFGPGKNGKGVLLSTAAAMLGDYATTAMQDVFTLSRGNEGHAAKLAVLHGARMVVVSETEEGRPWAEARIKAWTGGDKVSANFMHGNPFEFAPVCKLWFSGNHKPPLRNPDAAMRRRMHLVPLNYVPPTPDPELAEALREELPGILAWAIEGCLQWQERGLQPPPIVIAATDEYFADQNAIALWLAEICDTMPTAEVPSRTLFTSWRQWATARGDDPGSETRFSMELEKQFAKRKTKSGMVFRGIIIKPTDEGDRYPDR